LLCNMTVTLLWKCNELIVTQQELLRYYSNATTDLTCHIIKTDLTVQGCENIYYFTEDQASSLRVTCVTLGLYCYKIVLSEPEDDNGVVVVTWH
jgi:hypothetical protein